jgi:ferredoxin
MFSILAKSLKTGIRTEAVPFGRSVPFGFPVIDFARCTMCDECAKACPTGAIHSAAPEPRRRLRSIAPASSVAVRRLSEQAVPGRHERELRCMTCSWNSPRFVT